MSASQNWAEGNRGNEQKNPCAGGVSGDYLRREVSKRGQQAEIKDVDIKFECKLELSFSKRCRRLLQQLQTEQFDAVIMSLSFSMLASSRDLDQSEALRTRGGYLD